MVAVNMCLYERSQPRAFRVVNCLVRLHQGLVGLEVGRSMELVAEISVQS